MRVLFSWWNQLCMYTPIWERRFFNYYKRKYIDEISFLSCLIVRVWSPLQRGWLSLKIQEIRFDFSCESRDVNELCGTCYFLSLSLSFARLASTDINQDGDDRWEETPEKNIDWISFACCCCCFLYHIDQRDSGDVFSCSIWTHEWTSDLSKWLGRRKTDRQRSSPMGLQTISFRKQYRRNRQSTSVTSLRQHRIAGAMVSSRYQHQLRFHSEMYCERRCVVLRFSRFNTSDQPFHNQMPCGIRSRKTAFD